MDYIDTRSKFFEFSWKDQVDIEIIDVDLSMTKDEFEAFLKKIANNEEK